MKRSRIWILCGIALLLSVVIELFLFNSSYFTPILSNLKVIDIDISEAECGQSIYYTENNVLYVSENGTVTFYNLDVSTRYVRIYATGDKKLASLDIYTTDDNSSQLFVKTGKYYFSPDTPDSMVFGVYSQGAIHDLQLRFDSSCTGMRINRIVINQGRNFNFNIIRFIITLLILLAVAVIINFRLWKKDFDYQNKKHNTAISALVLFLLMISALVSQVGGPLVHEYPLKGDYETYGNYIQQTDAFIKGQIELDLAVPTALTQLDDPYDRSQRWGISMSWLWDKALYDGHAYSYFGIAPVVLIYYPFYALTGYMASDILVCTILVMAAIIFLCLLLREIIIRFNIRVNLLLLLLGMTTAVFGGMIFLLQSSANFYTVAVISGLSFLFGFMYFAFRACRCKTYPARYILFALSGLYFVFTIASRPNMALYILGILPLFVAVLMEKETKLSQRLMAAAIFTLPLVFGGAAIMWYNSVRFSSPFDFGNNYQLTVSNVKYNTIKLYLIPQTIFHYFLHAPKIIERFPYLYMPARNLENYRTYVYLGQNMGAFWYPATLGIFAIPGILKKKDKVKIFVYTILIAIALLLSFLDMCLAGVHVRYTADIIPILVLVGICILLELSGKKHRVFGTIVTIILCVMTITIGFAFIFDNEVHNMLHNIPGIFSIFAKPFI
ncbi:MAG: hypothetical protein A2Y17_08425 [Clostridiales bacterium GWF2_38_85]|nr:MAG: hypothetical protein A2Y17_08425 [Clostridiales bacterium GWF2_38_85]HBL83782.1 hypothetical protein [Clostridiales bacterium]